jgi:multicomponent Na+:H+ antiporter subunit D
MNEWIDLLSWIFLLAGLTRGKIRGLILLAAPLLGGLQLLGIEPGVEVQRRFLGYEPTPFRVDRLSLLFGYLFHIGCPAG